MKTMTTKQVILITVITVLACWFIKELYHQVVANVTWYW